MVIHSQGREIIANFIKREAGNNESGIPLANFKARVLAATGVSKNTYASICKETENIHAGESSSNEVFDSEEDEDDDSRVAAHDENDEETNTL
ncbi:hypothetical protein QE152_g38410 [Popillia japonica]|uniref:Uncharacterized protein n=1 Tax=Popillia japonica TaxID=7064 RepID=A0AAW1HYJ8_POPJA